MDVVLIDLGGVLFTFDHPRRLDTLGTLLGRSADEVDALFWRSGFSADCDAGVYRDAAAVRAEIRARSGFAGSDSELDEAWCSAFAPDASVLGRLRATSVPLVLFTNNGPLEEEVLTARYPDAFAPFDRLVWAHRLVADKPETSAYAQVAELLGVASSRIGFVDDSDTNVAAARSCGWTAVRYRALADLDGLL